MAGCVWPDLQADGERQGIARCGQCWEAALLTAASGLAGKSVCCLFVWEVNTLGCLSAEPAHGKCCISSTSLLVLSICLLSSQDVTDLLCSEGEMYLWARHCKTTQKEEVWFLPQPYERVGWKLDWLLQSDKERAKQGEEGGSTSKGFLCPFLCSS